MASMFLESSAKAACRSCRTSNLHARLFSSSSAFMIGPESPDYIDIPKPLQPQLHKKPEVKGTLPVPREVFPRRRPDKPHKAYLEEVARDPASDEPRVSKDHPQYEYIEWKRQMAAKRRENIRDGLTELYKRKTNYVKSVKGENAYLKRQRDALLTQQDRDDDRFTRSSVVKAMKDYKSGTLPDPDRAERLAKAKANYAAHVARKREQRMEAIHTLYTNARDFIINEEQLKAEIERVFPEGENPDWSNDRAIGDNIWNLGRPPTVSSMANKQGHELTKWDLVQGRTKRIAEELTGGTIG